MASSLYSTFYYTSSSSTTLLLLLLLLLACYYLCTIFRQAKAEQGKARQVIYRTKKHAGNYEGCSVLDLPGNLSPAALIVTN